MRLPQFEIQPQFREREKNNSTFPIYWCIGCERGILDL